MAGAAVAEAGQVNGLSSASISTCAGFLRQRLNQVGTVSEIVVLNANGLMKNGQKCRIVSASSAQGAACDPGRVR